MGNFISNEFYNEHEEEPFDFGDLDDYEKAELISYVKGMSLENLKVGDDFSTTVGDLNIECSEPIPMCIELYEKMAAVLPRAEKKTAKKMNRTFFVKPQFQPDDVTNYVSTQTRPVVIYQMNLYDVPQPKAAFRTNRVTIGEYTEAFNNFTYNKDMMGISKKILRHIPDYLKLRYVSAYNKMYRGEESPKDWAFAKGSFIYKASKKGAKDDVNSFRSIMVIPAVTNHFHRIMSIRLTEYLCNNGYINTTIQKGAVSGQSKPIFQQVYKVKNVIAHANQNKTSCAALFLDIKNAYGNVHLHVLYDILRKHHVDENLVNYLDNYYRNFQYYVATRDWTTPTYDWGNQGLVQGCPLSPILFVTALNYVLQHLDDSYKTEHGYDVGNGTKVMFTAFMDDICLVCKDRDSLSLVYKELDRLLKLLGLPISKEKSAVMLIGDDDQTSPLEGIPTTQTHKYLGEYISSNGTNTESYNVFIKYLGRKLESIQRRKVEPSEKVLLFNNYVMPWIQYRLNAMYDLKTFQKKKIMDLIMKYLRKWDHNGPLNLFITVMDTLNNTDDEVIKNMEQVENYDEDVIEDVDLSDFVMTGEIMSAYTKIDELEMDLEEILD